MIQFDQVYYYKGTEKSEGGPQTIEADLCIYGASSAGVAAAVQASRMGLKAVIADPGRHLGGLTTGGLGSTDIGNKAAIGGLSRSFYQAIGKHYGSSKEEDGSVWYFEPHVASAVYEAWMEEAGVQVYFEQQLEKAEVEQGRIKRLTMLSGDVFIASVFIDATYEGDLLAHAGVSYHVGREANSVYRETLNGVHFGHPNHNFYTYIDPYVQPGKPDSGLLYGVTDASPGFQGQGDHCVQAYNFRICLSNRPENRAPLPAPPGYNPEHYTLLLRYIESGIWDVMRLCSMMPNGKTDLNNWGGFSTDHIGANYRWPEGSYEEREAIFQDHVTYNLGLLYFLSTDERVPAHIRQEMSQWGLPLDEYTDHGFWTPQLYIREGRRMVSDVVMTEHHCRRHEEVDDSVGLAAYTMDSHNCRRIVIDGRAVNEGNVEVAPSAPYAISYRSIVPRAEECTNLIVPICLSSSHIAFGSIRMEPVFMILGQSAATAAALALEAGVPVQDVDYSKLRTRLEQDGQVLAWAR
ncbi:FAD-dependent oxidoreductase [Paenibacillus daejeonensis]|uniref:FAD-dependent oxidoreductase n=1 Tax=Paenibacillus daejeonensis TaxID=135193 RepID=UPI00036B5B74|nr:FAD-dependent oxidoreductase [Paenibacillus daejeonensis]